MIENGKFVKFPLSQFQGKVVNFARGKWTKVTTVALDSCSIRLWRGNWFIYN